MHRRWFQFTVAILLLALAWWILEWRAQGQLPSGSSLSGFACGVVAGLLILFESLLWLRRRWRGWAWCGSALWWMKAHIWLGILTLPLAVLHSGLTFGGVLSATLSIVFLLVFASGVYGLVMQQRIPRRMFDLTPAETVYAEIDEVVGSLRLEAERIVASISTAAGVLEVAAAGSKGRSRRPFGVASDESIETGGRRATDSVLDFYQRFINPYLQPDAADTLPLASDARAANLFHGLRCKAAANEVEAIDALKDICDQRRQLAAQKQLHFRLHWWLLVHVPLTAVLLVLLAMHAWLAFIYW